MKTKTDIGTPAVRVGTAMFKVLAVLNKQSGPVTAAFLRGATELPRSNVSAALLRLAEVGVLEVSEHPTATYISTGGVVKPRLQYQLTKPGFDWVKEVVASRSLTPRKSSVWTPVGVH